jgi:cytoskeleton protein RodZ
MQTIGERLEEARKRKGISIREAAETTKIRGDYLQKFEANTFDIDLPPLYIRGFVRTYARFLDLDPERIVSDVDALLLGDRKPQRRENREALGRVDFGAEPRSGDSDKSSASTGPANDKAMMIKFGLLGGGALVAIVVIVILINALFSRSPAKPAPQAAQPPAPTVQADPTQTVVFTAIETTRVKVVQEHDGKILLDNVALARGESRSIKKQGVLAITVEDRSKVRVEVNGRMINIPQLPYNQGNYGQFKLD